MKVKKKYTNNFNQNCLNKRKVIYIEIYIYIYIYIYRQRENQAQKIYSCSRST